MAGWSEAAGECEVGFRLAIATEIEEHAATVEVGQSGPGRHPNRFAVFGQGSRSGRDAR
jgi:hypothetical protein